jgi:hypothetical protein
VRIWPACRPVADATATSPSGALAGTADPATSRELSL